jgi:tRNA(Arg) A34 adenosine deaminase TadA
MLTGEDKHWYIHFVVEVNHMNKDELFMHKAIEIAMQARKEGNEPFGAILVMFRCDGLVEFGEIGV